MLDFELAYRCKIALDTLERGKELTPHESAYLFHAVKNVGDMEWECSGYPTETFLSARKTISDLKYLLSFAPTEGEAYKLLDAYAMKWKLYNLVSYARFLNTNELHKKLREGLDTLTEEEISDEELPKKLEELNDTDFWIDLDPLLEVLPTLLRETN